jgi:hypothetical protein
MRDNSEGYLELRDAYERDGLYFGVVRVRTQAETASLEFGVEREGYLALRRILESRPFGNLPGVEHRFFFTGSYGKEQLNHESVSVAIRIEAGINGKNFWFDCPLSLARNLKWFFHLKGLQDAAALRRIPE